MRTPVCDLLGIDVPIVQAPIGSASVPALAAAVSESGALGTIALSWTKPQDVAALVDGVRALTSRPFHANILMEWPPEERLDAVLATGVKVVSLTWGDPSAYVARVHDAGAVLIGAVGTAEEAKRFADAGVDVLCAQGWEAGGHVGGGVATMALVPRRRRRRRACARARRGWDRRRTRHRCRARARRAGRVGRHELPARRRGAAPSALPRAPARRQRGGCPLCDRPLRHRLGERAAPRAPEHDTGSVGGGRLASAGQPARRGEQVATRHDGAAIVRYSSAMPVAGISGDIESLSMWSGQGIGLLDRVQPAAEIVRELVEETDAAIARLVGR